MGYTTKFHGTVDVMPPLNQQEIEYLTKFADTRRMNRTKGPYYVEGGDFRGQAHDVDIITYNQPPKCQPGLWCQWIPTSDGTKIVWDENEKFYRSAEWMQYLIDHFIGSDPIAKHVDENLSFLQSHVVHGIIEAQGEDQEDHWFLVVENNVVRVIDVEDATEKTLAQIKSGINLLEINTDKTTE